MSTSYQFDPVDVDRLRMLLQLTPGGRIRLVSSARELAVGREIDLKLLEALGGIRRCREPTNSI